jgi:hypothetical protein
MLCLLWLEKYSMLIIILGNLTQQQFVKISAGSKQGKGSVQANLKTVRHLAKYEHPLALNKKEPSTKTISILMKRGLTVSLSCISSLWQSVPHEKMNRQRVLNRQLEYRRSAHRSSDKRNLLSKSQQNLHPLHLVTCCVEVKLLRGVGPHSHPRTESSGVVWVDPPHLCWNRRVGLALLVRALASRSWRGRWCARSRFLSNGRVGEPPSPDHGTIRRGSPRWIGHGSIICERF